MQHGKARIAVHSWIPDVAERADDGRVNNLLVGVRRVLQGLSRYTRRVVDKPISVLADQLNRRRNGVNGAVG